MFHAVRPRRSFPESSVGVSARRETSRRGGMGLGLCRHHATGAASARHASQARASRRSCRPCQYVTRTLYLSSDVPSGETGTVNCDAHAAVFFHSCDELSIRHVPPIGSLTSTLTGTVLWLRRV